MDTASFGITKFKIISSKVNPYNVGIAALTIVLLIFAPFFFVSEGACKKVKDKSKIKLETVYKKFIHFLKNKDIDAIISVLFWDVSDQNSVREKEYLENFSYRACDYLLNRLFFSPG